MHCLSCLSNREKYIIYYNLFPSVLLKLNSVIVEGSLPSLVVT